MAITWFHAAWPWFAALVGLALLLVVLGHAAWRLELSGRARGLADGSWIVAGGLGLGVASLAFVWARGAPPQLTFLLFGRKLVWRPRRLAGARTSAARRLGKASRRLLPRIDPWELSLQLLDERRHFRLRHLELDLVYGFRDPLLTGRLVGAIAALSAILPKAVSVRQTPRWDFEDGWEISLDAHASLRPGLVLLDLAAYVLRQRRHEREQDRRSRRESAQGRAGHLEERDDRRGAAAGR